MCRQPQSRDRAHTLFAAVPLALALLACDPAPRPRLLLIAIDGMDWHLALPLVREGAMPELARLMERGRFGWLDTLPRAVSPAVWTTIATGKTPERHGIRGFGERSGGSFRPYSSLDRRTRAFWNILGDFGRRVHVVGWWVSHPVEPISGVMVAQANTATPDAVRRGDAIRKGSLVEGLARQVHPPERTREMFDHVRGVEARLSEHLDAVFGERPGRSRSPSQRLWDASRWAFRADSIYLSIARTLAAEEPVFDLLAVYLGGTDVVGHRFWRHMEPQRFDHPPAPAEVEAFGGVIAAYYRYADAAIGELLRASPAGATVLVVSDHGMHAVHEDADFPPDAPLRKLVSGDHRDGTPGVLVAAGPGIRPPAAGSGPRGLELAEVPRVGSVLDVTPTLLALLGLPVARDMDGRVLEGLLDPARVAIPAHRIASHDSAAWLASRRQPRPAPPVDAERLEQLRDLGYID